MPTLRERGPLDRRGAEESDEEGWKSSYPGRLSGVAWTVKPKNI